MPSLRPAYLTILIVTLLAALPRITASIYTPSMPSLMDYFHTGTAAVKLTFTTYIFGLALGHLAYGPLSDRFGRRPILIAGLSLFSLMSLACAFAPSITALAAGRFLQACSAAAGGVLSRAIVRDLFGPDRTAKAFAYVAMATTLSPALGPIIGGELQHLGGWQTVFITLAVLGLLLLVIAARALPETRPISELTPTSLADFRRAFATLFRSRSFMGYSLNSAFLLSALLCFFGSAPFILIDGLGLAPRHYGYYTSIGVVGYITGNFIATRLPGHQHIERFVRAGSVVALLGSLLMLLLVLTHPQNVFSIIAPFVLMSMGAGIALPSGFAGSTNRYPQIAGTSSALAGFMNMSVSTLATLVMARFSAQSPLPLAIMMTLLCATALFTGLILRRGGDA